MTGVSAAAKKHNQNTADKGRGPPVPMLGSKHTHYRFNDQQENTSLILGQSGLNEHEDLSCYDRILVLFRQRVLLASGRISPSLDLTGARSAGTGCDFFEFGAEKSFD